MEALGTLAWAHVPEVAKSLIEKKVRGGEATLAASLGWAEDDLEQELFVALAAALEPSVGPVSRSELHLAWLDCSPGRLRRRASYGDGTLVVVPPSFRSPGPGPKRPNRMYRPGGHGVPAGSVPDSSSRRLPRTRTYSRLLRGRDDLACSATGPGP